MKKKTNQILFLTSVSKLVQNLVYISHVYKNYSNIAMTFDFFNVKFEILNPFLPEHYTSTQNAK